MAHNTQINVSRLVSTIKKTTVYTPLVEAVVNSIESIEDLNIENGRIVIELVRDKQVSIEEDHLPPVVEVRITDNGVGFNNKNTESFNTIYTEQKVRRGG